MKRRKPRSKKAEIRCVKENLWLRHGRYYARLKKSGKDIWKSLKTKDANIAKVRLEEFRREISASSINASKKDIPTLAEAITTTLAILKQEGSKSTSLKSIKTHLNMVGGSWLGPAKISSIRTEQLKDFLRERCAKRTGRTANLDLIHLRKVFRLAIERGWRWNDPTKGIKAFSHKERRVPVPSVDEIKSVMSAMRDGRMRIGCKRAADFIELMALSGLRLSEAQALRWEDIDLQKAILVVHEGKGGKSRVVDLFPSLRDFANRLLQNRGKPSAVIFPGDEKLPYNPKRSLDSACRIAGVPRFTFHGLRHAWATELVKAGIDFGTIAQWAGHNDGGMLIAKRYGRHMRRDHMQMAAQKINFELA